MHRNISKGTLLVSPHPDDISFSISGSILLDIFPTPITLFTIFGKTSFLGKHGVCATNLATHVRQNEDILFAQKNNLSYIHLNFPDVLLRSFNNNLLAMNAKVFDGNFKTKIVHACERHVKQLNPEIIVFPAALGWNIDHEVICNIFKSLCSKYSNIEFYCYEDLPYANNYTPNEIEKIIKKKFNVKSIMQQSLKHVLEEKINMVKLYRSQLHDKNLDKIISYAKKLNTVYGGERLWEV